MKREKFFLFCICVISFFSLTAFCCGGKSDSSSKKPAEQQDDSKTPPRNTSAEVGFIIAGEAVVGNSLNVFINATDPDSGNLTYSCEVVDAPDVRALIAPDPNNMSTLYQLTQSTLDPAQFSFVPALAGTYTLRASVVDGQNGVTTENITVAVAEISHSWSLTLLDSGDIVFRVTTNAVNEPLFTVKMGKSGDPLALIQEMKPETQTTILDWLTTATYHYEMTICNAPTVFGTALSKTFVGTFSELDLNRPPVANIASDPNVTVGSTIILDGSNSYDPDGDSPLYYGWGVTTRPSGSVTQIVDGNSPIAKFTPDIAGTYTFSLALSDGQALSTATTDVIVANSVDPQEDDPSTLYEDGNKIASTHIIFYKKTGGIEADIRPLLEQEGQAAFDAGGKVFLWGALNDWNPTEEFKAEVSNNKVIINVADLNLDGDENYGISFVVVLQGNFFWQDLQMEVDDLLLMGEDTSGGSVLVFRLNADGTLDNLPTGTIVKN